MHQELLSNLDAGLEHQGARYADPTHLPLDFEVSAKVRIATFAAADR